MRYLVLTASLLLPMNSLKASGPLPVPDRGFVSSQPARTWEEGLLCGNGTIGANALCRPLDERIIFSHERLFLPMGAPVAPRDQSDRLFEIRRLIDRGLFKQACQLQFDLSGQDGFMYPDYFVPAFDLTIRSQAEGEIRDYARSVDFQTGEATVHWADDRGVFERRMFVSRSAGVAVVLLTGPKAALGCQLRLEPREPSDEFNADSDIGFAFQKRLFHRGHIGRGAGYPKDAACRQGVDQKPAFRCFCLVDQQDANIGYIVVHHVTEEEKLQHRRQDDNRTDCPVPEKLDEFLADHFPDAKPGHRQNPSFFNTK